MIMKFNTLIKYRSDILNFVIFTLKHTKGALSLPSTNARQVF